MSAPDAFQWTLNIQIGPDTTLEINRDEKGTFHPRFDGSITSLNVLASLLGVISQLDAVLRDLQAT